MELIFCSFIFFFITLPLLCIFNIPYISYVSTQIYAVTQNMKL